MSSQPVSDYRLKRLADHYEMSVMVNGTLETGYGSTASGALKDLRYVLTNHYGTSRPLSIDITDKDVLKEKA